MVLTQEGGGDREEVVVTQEGGGVKEEVLGIREKVVLLGRRRC